MRTSLSPKYPHRVLKLQGLGTTTWYTLLRIAHPYLKAWEVHLTPYSHGSQEGFHGSKDDAHLTIHVLYLDS